MRPAPKFGLAATFFIPLILVACGGGSDSPLSLADQCSSFRVAALPHDASVDSTALQPATIDRPEVCAVRGSIRTAAPDAIHFKLELPAPARWNGKSLTVGGGGFDGFIITDLPGWATTILAGNPEAVSDFSVITSDSGHHGQPPAPQLDFSWVRGNEAGLVNHAHLANHLTLQVATEVITRFYGSAPRYRYMLGLSNGGRSGLMAAQRYPGDYHGIVALAPAISQQAFAVNVGSEVIRPNFASASGWLSPAKIATFERAQIAACDLTDNLADGVISNHEACNFDPVAIQCTGASAPDCLTEAEVASVRRILSPMNVPVTLADGLVGYPAYGRGAETQDWPAFMFGSDAAEMNAINFRLAEEIIRHAITGDPGASVLLHDPVPFAARYRQVSETIDATDPDLSAFRQGGGKLLVWHGSADGCVSYRRTAQYHASVVARMGNEGTGSFMRFFVSPGVGHGLTGPGANEVDFIAALEGWVERDAAPQTLLASKRSPDRGSVLFTRPVCEYPAYPRYSGTGDSSTAGSFQCVLP